MAVAAVMAADPSGRHFVERFAFDVSEEHLDEARWRNAWRAVIGRHDALRTAFDVTQLESRVTAIIASSVSLARRADESWYHAWDRRAHI